MAAASSGAAAETALPTKNTAATAEENNNCIVNSNGIDRIKEKERWFLYIFICFFIANKCLKMCEISTLLVWHD